MSNISKMPDLEKELLEQYYKNLKYKESLIEERKKIDEEYENTYIKYLEGVNKVNELKYTIAPIEEEIKKNDNLKLENDKQIKIFLTNDEQLKIMKEKLKEENRNECKKFAENVNVTYEKIKELPETFTNASVEGATREAKKHLRELTELKESLTIKVNKIKQEPNSLEDYVVPSNVNESLKQINIINIKHFGDITKNTSTMADIQKNINTLKKKISEVESKPNVDSN